VKALQKAAQSPQACQTSHGKMRRSLPRSLIICYEQFRFAACRKSDDLHADAFGCRQNLMLMPSQMTIC
jgi:hypothetical protein